MCPWCRTLFLTFFVVSLGVATSAQELLEDRLPAKNYSLLLAPIPKVNPKSSAISDAPKSVFHEPWWKLDRDVMALGFIHGSASLMDGITTRHCPVEFVETDPLDRLFLGQRPTWSRMIPLGSLEIFGAALLAQHMKHSKWKLVRKLHSAPQILFVAQHTYEGADNVTQTNAFLKRGY